MTVAEARSVLKTAVEAARLAGQLMRRNLYARKKATAETAHDIKLELDVQCQRRIEKALRAAFPKVSILGEEGLIGDSLAPQRWVVDPIDGTVNYAYGIPHACVSIAWQERGDTLPAAAPDFQTLVGVVYDPFCEELWTAIRGQAARLNHQPVHVSQRQHLREAVISLGFAKYDSGLKKMLPKFQKLVPLVRKMRIMGSAALDLVYVASGRLDAYIESGVRLWDIAAGGLILECAGGEFWRQPLPGDYCYHVIATNGPMRKPIEAVR